tara:strand:- start:815 stop:1831 length:1017 start_codon:yes stop_codon:yes gene_type:complete
MKFALIQDAVGNGGISSFRVTDGKAYTLDTDKLYTPKFSPAGLNENCFLNTYNYPFLFNNSYFIEWSEFKEDLPDLDLELIFLVIERTLNRQDEFPWVKVSNIRKKYPNAKIVGFIKEIWMGKPYDYEDPRHKARIDFLNKCDSVITNRPKLKEFQQLADNVDKPFNFVAQPHNIDYFYDNFGDDKQLAIWEYLPCQMQRRNKTNEFVEYISKKYNIPVKRKMLLPNQDFNHISIIDFIKQWSSCLFHFNLDPVDYFPGNQITQVVSTGAINIGGVNDNHYLLCPETATCDMKILEDRFVEYLEDEDKRNEIRQKSWDRLHKYFSFDAVRLQIKNIKF